MDIFKAIAAAKASADRNPPLYEDKDTQGIAVIAKCKQFESRAGDNLAVVEISIKEASGKGNAPAPGSIRSIMFGLEKEEDLGRLKTFILRVLGVNEKEVSPEDLADTVKAIFTEQAFSGFRFRYEVRPHTTKKGVLTSVVDFFHVPGQTPEVVDAERKALGV